MTTTQTPSRQARNIAAALYVHAGGPNEQLNLDEIMHTAEGCARGINDLLEWLEANPNATEEQIQCEAYECGKRHLDVKQIRTFFSSIYLMLLANPHGPRLGFTVRIIGSELFVQKIRTRLDDPFGWLSC